MTTIAATRSYSCPDLVSLVNNQSKVRSPLSEAMQSVTNVEVKPARPATKNDILSFRDDYRRNAATMLSKRNEDFKQAYQNGNLSQKRELENIATTLSIVEKNFDNTENSSAKKEILNALTDKLFLAIKKGNAKPDSHFTNEQNHSVNRDNKEQKDYQKAVNEIGKFLSKEFTTARAASKLVIPDVIGKCNDVLKPFDLNVSSVPDYLEQSAVNAERNMRSAVVSDGSSNMQGVDFLKQLTMHTNSLLNYPNYLRGFDLKKESADNNPSPDNLLPENSSPAEEKKNSPYTSPAINNVFNPSVNANPIININLGDKLDRLADLVEKLVTQGSKDIYERNLYEPIAQCTQIKGSDKLPHKSTDVMLFSALTTGDKNYSEPATEVIELPKSDVDILRSDDIQDGTDHLVIDYEENKLVQSIEQTKHVVASTPHYDKTAEQYDKTTPQYDKTTPSWDDTFMAKAMRAGKSVILSQQGLRPNIKEADNAAHRRQHIDHVKTSSSAVSSNQFQLNSTSNNRSRSLINNKIDANKANSEQQAGVFSSGRSHQKISFSFSPELYPNNISTVHAYEPNNHSSVRHSSVRSDNAVNDETLTGAHEGSNQDEVTASKTSKPQRKQFYSPYLDESGKPRNPGVTLTTDGLHMPRR